MSKLLKKVPLAEDNSYHISQIKSNIESLINPHLMIGSANRAYVPCNYIGSTQQVYNSYVSTGGYVNIGAIDDFLYFELPLPTNRGGLKLHVATLYVGVRVADVTDYVDAVYILGHTRLAETVIFTDGTNRTAAGDYTYNSGGNNDASGYDVVRIAIKRFNSTATDLQIVPVNLECYYA